MSDIVERLRGHNQRAYFGDGAIMYDAAAEITALRARVAELEGALEDIVLRWQPGVSHEEIDVWIDGIAKPINETPCEPTENK